MVTHPRYPGLVFGTLLFTSVIHTFSQVSTGLIPLALLFVPTLGCNKVCQPMLKGGHVDLRSTGDCWFAGKPSEFGAMAGERKGKVGDISPLPPSMCAWVPVTAGEGSAHNPRGYKWLL